MHHSGLISHIISKYITINQSVTAFSASIGSTTVKYRSAGRRVRVALRPKDYIRGWVIFVILFNYRWQDIKKYPKVSGLVVADRGSIPRLANNRQGNGKYVGVVRDGKLISR